ncbi:MAG: 5-carboxymethylaminomethyluridine-tRNA synthase subunit MnmG [Candidatus Westeberhardia cardiocondylae]|nr:5-carboxymethylaminomethyluridine-tRNA synthase subunit MnmG [Candidatus Westeberhardia cardiocondylae]
MIYLLLYLMDVQNIFTEYLIQYFMSYYKNFDVIVIGGGHAGVEASMASARMGCCTLLLTHNIDMIGHMPCNPAIGGIGKSHLVKEIDAMGGIMAQAIDSAGIHYKMLNASKGPAVRATRIQADKRLYKSIVLRMLERQSNLLMLQESVENFIIKNSNIIGVVTSMGLKFYSSAVVLTVGTFLNKKEYVGVNEFVKKEYSVSLDNLSCCLRDLSFSMKRLKTGTPPRISLKSLNFSKLVCQYGDIPMPTFSFLNSHITCTNQVPCYITHTNEVTHDIVRKNLHFSPIYSGIIQGIGPRYCPSIEDKIFRFSEKSSHRVFLEPEGLDSDEVYPNGISTSLPLDIQIQIVRSIPGLECANIIRPGYIIEYGVLDPRGLRLTLESKLIHGLFFAGQINGTSGYEEAAAQGMLAGLNAARLSMGKEGWFPLRSEAYLGVLVDDLCSLGTEEPYRMFTARAEYRLCLREDNADIRLTEIGRKLGMVNDERWNFFCDKLEKIDRERNRLQNIWIKHDSKHQDVQILNASLSSSLTHKVNGLDLLRRPEVTYDFLTSLMHFSPAVVDKKVSEQIEVNIKYQGYIERQKKEISRLLQYEYILFPDNIDFSVIPGLSNEVVEKLNKYRPCSLGQASRISGITPVSISVLLIWLKKLSCV